jgi:hypothetical protein
LRGFVVLRLTGRKPACGRCPVRSRCVRTPHTTPVRQVAVRVGPTGRTPETYTARRKRKIDSAQGREMRTRRFATAAPGFGNLRYNKRLYRFTLRGRTKVDGQWTLYGLVHDIEKLAHQGYRREAYQ